MTLHNILNEQNEEDIKKQVESLRNWYNKQPHLPKDFDDDSIFTAFVSGTKSLEISKKKLDGYLSLKNKCSFLRIKDPRSAELTQVAKSIKNFFLPGLTPEGCRVAVTSPTGLNQFYDHEFKMARKAMMLELSLHLRPDVTDIILVYDCEKAGSSMISKIKPNVTFDALNWFMETLPFRLKKILIINASTVSEVIYNIVKPFLKKKISERIEITKEGATCLKKHFPDKMIPSDWSGLAKSTDELNEDFLQLLDKHRDWFLENSNKLVDESKRPKDSSYSGQLNFGIEGSFKTLSID